jgi:hypothetical protein
MVRRTGRPGCNAGAGRLEGLDARLNKLAVGVRLRNWQAVFLHSLKVELDGFVDEPSDFGSTFTNGYTSRKIWNIGAET